MATKTIDQITRSLATITGSERTPGRDGSGDFRTTYDIVMEYISKNIDTGVIIEGGAVFNESGADVDFRIESDTSTHALFVQGSDGNVGIGTTSPDAKLSIKIQGSGTHDMVSWHNSSAATRFIWQYDETNVRMHISNRSGTPLFTVDENGGNVGIGTTTPSQKLYVNGGNILTKQAVDTGFNGLITMDSSSTYGTALRTNADNSATIRASSIDTITLKNGKVGIGTDDPGELLHVSSTSAASIVLSDTSANANHKSMRITYDGSTSDALDRITIQGATDAGVYVANLVSFHRDGKVGLGTTTPSYKLELSTDSAGKPTTSTWTIVSDERIKENIEIADNDICYDIVKNLPLKRYGWKYYDEKVANDQVMLGWVAQDVQKVFPKAVQVHEFEIKPEIKDEDGNITQEREVIEDCLDLNADQINKALYGAVQKLIEKVEYLEEKISILQSK